MSKLKQENGRVLEDQLVGDVRVLSKLVLLRMLGFPGLEWKPG